MAARYYQVNLTGDKVSDQRGELIVVIFGPAIFDCQVLALDKADIAQSLAEESEVGCIGALREAMEIANYRTAFAAHAASDRAINEASSKAIISRPLMGPLLTLTSR